MKRSLDLGSRLRQVGPGPRTWMELLLRLLEFLGLATLGGVVFIRDSQLWGLFLVGGVAFAPFYWFSGKGFGKRVLWVDVYERGFVLVSLFRRRVARRSTLTSVSWMETSDGEFSCEVHFKNGAKVVMDAGLSGGRSIPKVLHTWWKDGVEIGRVLGAVERWEEDSHRD